MSVYSEVKAFLAQFQQAHLAGRAIGEGRPMIVAVSGGPDSVTLLHLLARRGLYRPQDLVVAHLNHQLRPSAEEDARYVADLAARWELSCQTASVDVAAKARERGSGIEEAGRQARYEFLGSVADRAGAGIIVTGHTAGDQAETILMHLLRGSGTEGLTGMRAAGPAPERPDLTLLRPLLGVSRADVLDYCRRFGLDPVDDPTNVDVAYFRNRIRHELLPRLHDYNPAIERRLLDLAAVMAGDDEIVQRELERVWPGLVAKQEPGSISLDLAAWRSLSLGLRRRALRQACGLLQPKGTETSFAAVELARQTAEAGQTGAHVHLPGEVLMRLSYDQLVFEGQGLVKLPADYPQYRDQEPRPVPVPGVIGLANGWTIELDLPEAIHYPAILANQDPWTAFLSVDEPGQLFVRSRRPGDTIQPLGMSGQTKMVSDLMIDDKIPAAYRSAWPLIATEQQVIWVVGSRVDERAKVRPDSGRVIRIRARPATK